MEKDTKPEIVYAILEMTVPHAVETILKLAPVMKGSAHGSLGHIVRGHAMEVSKAESDTVQVVDVVENNKKKETATLRNASPGLDGVHGLLALRHVGQESIKGSETAMGQTATVILINKRWIQNNAPQSIVNGKIGQHAQLHAV